MWKSFTRGLHPIYMEGYYDNAAFCPPNYEIRDQMGNTRAYALRMNLANALPSAALASTGWCLADAGDAYLVYAPSGGQVTLNLTAATGALEVEWFRPSTGQTYAATSVTGGATRSFTPPFTGQAVLFVQRDPSGGVDGDANGDGLVNVSDMLLLIGGWGNCSGCGADLNGDGVVNTTDLLLVVSNWG